MSNLKINLLKIRELIIQKPRRKIFILAKIFAYTSIVIFVFFASFSVQVIFSGDGSLESLKKWNLFGQIKHLAQSADKTLVGEEEDRINILLLGMGGEGHDGPYLTDTIILSSFRPSTGEVTFLSIPRDLVIPMGDYGWRKVNNANAFGETKEEGNGGKFAAEVLSKTLGIPIPYYVRIDFEGFIKLIDDLGDIEVEVENTLDDYKYPSHGKEEVYPIEDRYEHLHIEEGLQKMNGDLALKYVRSRHALGLEGSDFARSRRQQKVLLALKKKIFSLSTLTNPVKINSLLGALNDHLTTNMEIWEMLRLAQLGREADLSNILHHVLDDSPNNFLYASRSEDGAYILLPKDGDFTQIKTLAQNIFDKKALENSKPKQKTKAKIEIQNGTTINGLANKISQRLENYNFEIIKIDNAQMQNYEKTVIYDLSGGQYPETLESLKEKLNANVSVAIPAWLGDLDPALREIDETPQAYNTQADILIILGKEANL